MNRRGFIGAMSALTGAIVLGRPRLVFSEETGLPPLIQPGSDGEILWRTVREQFLFPADYVYLNTGGIGALPAVVLNEVEASMRQGEIHPRPGHNEVRWQKVKRKLAPFLSPKCSPDEIALLGCATEGINVILNGLPLQKGDEVITSAHEHPALHIPLLNRMKRAGIIPKIFESDMEDGLGNVRRIESLITKRTRLIFLSHITCTTGQLFPLKEIGRLSRDRGLWFAVDGAQAAGALPMDLADSAVDFYTFSGHKWMLGPKRTGALYVRKDLLDTLAPSTVGAYSDDSYDIGKGELRLQPTAQRYEYATQNEALFHGLGKALDFISAIGLNHIYSHNRKLAERFYSGLEEIPQAVSLSPMQKQYRTSMITFRLEGRDYRDVAAHLGETRIRVRSVPEAGLEAIRVSFHLYNSESDVDKILSAIEKML